MNTSQKKTEYCCVIFSVNQFFLKKCLEMCPVTACYFGKCQTIASNKQILQILKSSIPKHNLTPYIVNCQGYYIGLCSSVELLLYRVFNVLFSIWQTVQVFYTCISIIKDLCFFDVLASPQSRFLSKLLISTFFIFFLSVVFQL